MTTTTSDNDDDHDGGEDDNDVGWINQFRSFGDLENILCHSFVND